MGKNLMLLANNKFHFFVNTCLVSLACNIALRYKQAREQLNYIHFMEEKP